MIKEDLRACAKELVGFHKRFAPCFRRIERYVLEVPVSTKVWTQDPSKAIPPYSRRGQPRNAHAGTRFAPSGRSPPPSAWQTFQPA